MTKNTIDAAIANARAKVASGTPDYLDEVIVELANAWQNAETLLSPKLTALKLAAGGFEAKIDGKGVAQVMAHAFWDLLTETKAKNYVTITFEREGREIEVIVQKREGKTAHELRVDAEAERDRLVTELATQREAALRLTSALTECEAQFEELKVSTEQFRTQNADLLSTLDHSATHKALAALAAENGRLREQVAPAPLDRADPAAESHPEGTETP